MLYDGRFIGEFSIAEFSHSLYSQRSFEIVVGYFSVLGRLTY